MAEEEINLLNALVAGYLEKVSPGLAKKFKVWQKFTLFLFIKMFPLEPSLLTPLRRGHQSGRGGGSFLQDIAAQAEARAGDQGRTEQEEEEGGGGGK